MKEAKGPGETPETEEIFLRGDMLSLVVQDLRFAFESARIENGDSEETAEKYAMVDIVKHLIAEATHIAAHSVGYESKKLFGTVMRGVLEAAIESHEDCVHIVNDETRKEESKHLS